MINQELQPQVEKNLAELFNIQEQANTQLVETLSGITKTQLSPSDLILSTDDVQTIISLNNME